MKMKSGDWKKLVCLSVAIWMLLFGTSFAKPFKGATFDIDVPIKYKMTVYKETSEMAFFAVDKDGASVSVVVQPSPFLKEDRVWTHDEKFKLGNQFIQTVTQSIIIIHLGSWFLFMTQRFTLRESELLIFIAGNIERESQRKSTWK